MASQSTRRTFEYYAALIGMTSPIIWILLVFIMGFVHPGYDHLENFMSTLGAVGAPFAFVQRINFFQFGASIILLGFALYREMEKPSPTAVISLTIIGLGIFLSGIFSEDMPHPDSFTNRMHAIVGLPSFLLIIFFPLFAGIRFRKNEKWQGVAKYSMAMSPLLFIALFLMIYTDRAPYKLAGLFQRLFLGIWMVWMVMTAYNMYKLETE